MYAVQVHLYRIAVYFWLVDAHEITVLQVPKFKAEATVLIGESGIEALAVYLIAHPDAGQVVPGAGGLRKLRWGLKARGSVEGTDHLRVRCDCLPRVPAELLREECQDGSDHG